MHASVYIRRLLKKAGRVLSGRPGTAGPGIKTPELHHRLAFSASQLRCNRFVDMFPSFLSYAAAYVRSPAPRVVQRFQSTASSAPVVSVLAADSSSASAIFAISSSLSPASAPSYISSLCAASLLCASWVTPASPACASSVGFYSAFGSASASACLVSSIF